MITRLSSRRLILVALAYVSGLCAVRFAACRRRRDDLPKADGIVALTGGGARLDTRRGAVRTRRGQAASDQRRRPGDHQGDPEACDRMAGGVSIAAPISAMRRKTPMAMPQEAADWARAHDFHSLIIVTARYHMPRSLQEFSSRDAGRDLDCPIRWSRAASTLPAGGGIRAPCFCCTANM